MVAARSPSSNSSRPSNPKLNTLRKSSNFDLSKSCSGSEIPQRNSSSNPTSARASLRSSFEQKENQKDTSHSKPAKTRSPAVNPSKRVRSFMAPTISASSKITAASPKKKILEERNQVVRDNMKNNIVSSEGMEGKKIRQKPEIGFDSEEISSRSGTRKLDFDHSKDHHQSEATRSVDAVDLDHDPSLPPYDPMKNYLSPRPRFLHYKPNTRIEQHQDFIEDLLYVGEGRRLEDSFYDSESSDDSSGYTAQSSPIKEPEFDNLMRTQQAQVPDENHVSESRSLPEPYKPKTWSFGSSKLIKPFALALSVLLFSVPFTDSPILYPFNLKDQSLAVPLTMPLRVLQHIHLYDYLDAARWNLQGLVIRMRQWSINSIEILVSSGFFSKEELDMSHYFNTTLASSMDQGTSLDFCSSSELELAQKENIINRQNDVVDNMEMEFEIPKTDGEALPCNEEDVAETLKVELAGAVNGDSTELVEWKMEEGNNPKFQRHNSFFDPAVQFGTMNKSDQLEKIEIAISDEVGIAERLEEKVLKELGNDLIHSFNKEDINSSAYPVDETQITNEKDFHDAVPLVFSDTKLLMLVVLGMFASVALATKLISLIKKQKKTTSDDKSPKKKTSSVSGGTKSYRHAYGDYYCNRGGLAEMVCDSGPTETSYSLNNSLFFTKQRSNVESHDVTPDHEIMQRRDSGVSSSISYGSFTSFERCYRNSNKQEKVMTPVRRSSRIRNRVSSS
ncbi:hypothetical protein KFK09_020876 [Dendrobium nobile]|uniref:Uncharacterized protein n=1 Tax=Dendrobium nobile TaxID=94219 RepID=A0A8T3AMW7_DENNO|nr:hypothetical protein KFK09_020876 [Dendrobium nobile]